MDIGDGFTNLVAQLGTLRDKTAQGSFVYAQISADQIDALYRSTWLGRKIIDIPASDMTREWRRWQADEAQVKLLENAEKRLQVRAKVTRALKWARLYGGSAIILGDGSPTPDQPMNAVGKDGLKFIHIVPKDRLGYSSLDLDPLSPNYGLPPMWQVMGDRGNVQVHPSRVIPLIGAEPPPATSGITPWGDSVYDALRDALIFSATASAVMASMLPEAKVDVITVPNLQASLARRDGEALLIKRFQLAATLKGINGMLILGEGDKYDQKTLNFSGLPEVHMRLLQEVSGAADIPVTRLMGQSPSGLQSTGESDLQNYYDGISAKQEDILRPILDRIDAALVPSALGAVPADLWWEFNELWQMSEKDQADIFVKTAQAVKQIAETGLVPDEAMSASVVALFDGEGMLPGLADAMTRSTAGAAAAAAEAETDLADAQPRSLYVSRKVINADDIIAWAKGQGFASTLEAGDLHVTVAFSRAAVDWMRAGEDYADDKGHITVRPGGPRVVEPLGDKGAVVLMFSSTWLQWRWRQLRDIGCSWDHGDEYQPHITLTYQPGDVDPAKVEPYRGEIVLGPEVFEDLDDDWAANVVEDAFNPDQPREPGGSPGGGRWARIGGEVKSKEEEAASDILSLVERGDYDFYGIRVDDLDPVALPSKLPSSRVWVNGDPTAELLNGTSAVRVTASSKSVNHAMKQMGLDGKGVGYVGRSLSLIAGYSGEGGYDDGEIIIQNASVLAVWERTDDMGKIARRVR